jgi:hypothetical protein
MKSKGMCWTGWCYSQSWGPAMLKSENPEVRNSSGNLMYKACHDTVPVLSVVDVKRPVSGSFSVQNISIDNSAIRFNCAKNSTVTLSLYTLSGRFIKEVLNRTFAMGTYSIKWNDPASGEMSVAPGQYSVRLKINESEFNSLVYVAR